MGDDLSRDQSSKDLEVLQEIHFPHSLSLLYSPFIYDTGFKVNSGEFKVMGLTPYGEPKYKKLIVDNLIDVKTDGSYRSRSTIGRIRPRSISETHPLSSWS